LSFSVELPDFVVPDNFFANALFECVDIFINHELISAKASNADNYLTDLFVTREVFNQPYSNNANLIAGYFNDKNMDADEFNTASITSRRHAAVKVTKAGKHYYKYVLYAAINHGLGNNTFKGNSFQ